MNGRDMHDAGTGDAGECIKVSDFMHRHGVGVDSTDDKLLPEDTLITGRFLNKELRHGLVVHMSDVIEERAFTVTSHLREGLSCIFFLEGRVDTQFGDRCFSFSGDRQGTLEGAAVMSTTPEYFMRASRGRQHLRHLVVSATPEWLDVDGLTQTHSSIGARLLKDHLAAHRWITTPRVTELVRQMVLPTGFVPELHGLYLESRTIEIVAETLTSMMRSDETPTNGGLLSRRDVVCIRRAKEFIAANLAAPLTVEIISRGAGISPSGLQRLFRISEGRSVFDYVRHLRLERAFEALRARDIGIQEASILAGYTSPNNFATAFRKAFGMTPREAMAQLGRDPDMG